MAETFTIKQNDTSPRLLYQLDLPDGQTLNGSVTVRFHMAQPDGTVVVDELGAVWSADDQQTVYNWAAADTAADGTFKAEFEVTFDDGSIETFPNNEYLLVKVYPDLA